MVKRQGSNIRAYFETNDLTDLCDGEIKLCSDFANGVL
jgi:hypothetical protein